jgi:hypothetical protein
LIGWKIIGYELNFISVLNGYKFALMLARWYLKRMLSQLRIYLQQGSFLSGALVKTIRQIKAWVVIERILFD